MQRCRIKHYPATHLVVCYVLFVPKRHLGGAAGGYVRSAGGAVLRLSLMTLMTLRSLKSLRTLKSLRRVFAFPAIKTAVRILRGRLACWDVRFRAVRRGMWFFFCACVYCRAEPCFARRCRFSNDLTTLMSLKSLRTLKSLRRVFALPAIKTAVRILRGRRLIESSAPMPNLSQSDYSNLIVEPISYLILPTFAASNEVASLVASLRVSAVTASPLSVVPFMIIIGASSVPAVNVAALFC